MENVAIPLHIYYASSERKARTLLNVLAEKSGFCHSHKKSKIAFLKAFSYVRKDRGIWQISWMPNQNCIGSLVPVVNDRWGQPMADKFNAFLRGYTAKENTK